MRISKLQIPVSVVVALVVWCIAVYFFLSIQDRESRYQTQAASSQLASQKQIAATQLHMLAQNTQSERDDLANLLNVDIVSVVNTIDNAGKAAGVSLKLGDAVPESTPPQSPIRAVDFVVQAQGSFANIMRAVRLFETLPVPSLIEALDIQQVPDSGKGGTTWQMNASIRVLTTLNVSS
jgi:Tfp pilus assembly protein PilO